LYIATSNSLKVFTILAKIFSKPGKVKYGNIHLLAILAGALYRYHQDFVIKVIDNVLEYIVLGLEQNDFKFNQRRIAEVKYLAELYNFRMLDHPVIFDTMYRIMTFGHGMWAEGDNIRITLTQRLGGPPVPGRINPFDMPDDFFRIRLVATLLETCGIFFNRGIAGKKLDYFLSFFQVNLIISKFENNIRLTHTVLHLHERSSPYGYRIHRSGRLRIDKTTVEACIELGGG
jgi:regulator of nonsense transcripts 2